MQKNFSTLLALRYLNPVRTHVSVITLISLAGVALGVMVLIVVLSVMDGFEDLIKSRVLGREPHIVLQRPAESVDPATGEQEWRDQVAKLESLDSVTNVYPLVRDYVFVINNDQYIQSDIKGMDTANPETVANFKKLITAGDGDMGQGYVATISTVFAEQTGIMVGDKLEILSTRNFQQLKPFMDQRDFTPLVDQKGAELDKMVELIQKNMAKEAGPDGEREAILNPLVVQLKTELVSWLELDIRVVERRLINELLPLFKAVDYEEDENGKNFYELGRKQEILDKYEEIKTLNVYKADSEAISEVALPKDITVVAIYQTDIYAPGPHMIVPLSLAQEISGINDSGIVTDIAVHLKEPYYAKQELEKMRGEIANYWLCATWMQRHEKQFSLISSQKSMMVVALSFIILVAVFSIGAVMFTITYQKKKEIGVMKALGATPAQITKVFTLQGVIVGLFGALIGWGLGMIVLANLDAIQDFIAKLGFNPFDKSFYGVKSMPYIVTPAAIAVVLVGAFVLCTIAALVPAWFASRADAAKSLRSM